MDRWEDKTINIMYRADCPELETLRDYQFGFLQDASQLPIEQHLTTCLHCKKEVAFLGDVEDMDVPSVSTPLKTPLQRNLVATLRQLARGAAGEFRSSRHATDESESSQWFTVDDVEGIFINLDWQPDGKGTYHLRVRVLDATMVAEQQCKLTLHRANVSEKTVSEQYQGVMDSHGLIKIGQVDAGQYQVRVIYDEHTITIPSITVG